MKGCCITSVIIIIIGSLLSFTVYLGAIIYTATQTGILCVNYKLTQFEHLFLNPLCNYSGRSWGEGKNDCSDALNQLGP